MNEIHELKVSMDHWYKYLKPVSWSIRNNDRNFQKYDIGMFNLIHEKGIYFRDTCVLKLITDVLTHEEFPEGIKPGYCILTLKLIKAI